MHSHVDRPDHSAHVYFPLVAEVRVAHGYSPPPKGVTEMEREIAEWLKDLGNQTTSEDTKRGYWYSVREFQRFAAGQGAVTIAGVTRTLVTDWYASYRTRGISPHTIQRHGCALRSFLRYCRDVGHVDRTLDAPFVRARRHKLPKVLTDEQVGRVLTMIGRRTLMDIRDRALIEFLRSTGCRASEVCNAALDDVRFYKDTQSQLWRGELIVTGKGAKERTVWLTTAAAEALRAYLDRARRPAPIPKHERALFVSREGHKLDRKILGQMVRRRASDAGLGDGVTTHWWRHTFATRLLERGASLEHVRRMLGHTSLATTQVYLDVRPDDCRKAHHLLEDAPTFVDLCTPVADPPPTDMRRRQSASARNAAQPSKNAPIPP